ncbi:hypothetical protein [Paenibacillus oleatilyticus]|uniref:Uncharacterized protein n=1 Tax=Paenibacillus oleatilyticus TaxID=2594886 RepID=A0ABV4V3T2_9BACL
MTVPVICIAIAVILVIALIMYNMRSMMSSPVPRSERQFPGHSEKAPGKGPQAEAPAGPAVQEAVAAKRPPAQKPIAQSGRERTPEAADTETARTSAKLADPEYRRALRGFAQPARPESPSGKAGEAPMKDDDFRTALRSMHNKK